jgi:hypothetical protein
MSETFEIANQIAKVDTDLGLVFGYAIISKQSGVDYYDVQGDHIPESAMLEAATEFMVSKREAKEMHAGDRVGEIVFAWPMTSEIAKAFNIVTETTGLLIAMKPNSKDILEKFRDGSYTGFSIGGKRVQEVVIDA